MLINQLKKLGFSDGEARVYLANLELGEASASRIASKAKIERTTTYGFLESLKKRGLVSLSKRNKKTVYSAETPKKLKTELEEKSRFVDAILPELLSITNVIDKKPIVKFYENREGIYDIYRDSLLYADEPIHMWMSNPWYDDEKFWRDFYVPTRLEKKIMLYAILPNTAESVAFTKEKIQPLRETKIVDSKEITSDIMIYGKRKIAIISFDEMTGLTLESKHLHDTLLFIFKTQWNILNK